MYTLKRKSQSKTGQNIFKKNTEMRKAKRVYNATTTTQMKSYANSEPALTHGGIHTQTNSKMHSNGL